MDTLAENAVAARDMERLRGENERLRGELEEAKETLRAIREGEIDALVIASPQGDRVYTLQSAEQTYRLLIEQIREGAVMLIGDGTIHYANRAFAEMVGRPLEQVMGSEMGEYVEGADRGTFENLLGQGRGGTAQGEVSLRASDGGVLPVFLGVSMVSMNGVESMCVVVTDLRERKRSEQILASEQFVRRLIDHTPMGVAVVGRDMRYLLANPVYQASCGDVRGSIAGREAGEVFPAGVAKIVGPAMEGVLRSGQGVELRGQEVPVRGRSWWNIAGVPLRDGAGRTEGVLIVTEDVTERKLAEEALARAKGVAEEARAGAESANKAKDQFLAVLSHELRTPLSPALMLVASYEHDLNLPETVRQDMATVRRNIELETRIIDDLLDLSRIANGKMQMRLEAVSVQEVVQRALETCAADITGRRIHLRQEFQAREDVVSGDPARLQQVFWNLLKNAVKFSREGGELTVSCRNNEEGRVEVVVRDTGIGIAPEALGRIFSAFEQADGTVARRFGGLGLGLAISKAIVDLHGGRIRAQSAGEGKGATFTVEMPVAAKRAAVGTAATDEPVAGAGRRLRCLLVEDHVDTAKTLSRLLVGSGHRVQIAGSIAAALRYLAQGEFDLLLSDLGLPDGTGYDLMEQVRERYGVPSVCMSGYGMEGDLAKSREAGFAAHLVKPISFEQLEETIGRVVGVRP